MSDNKDSIAIIDEESVLDKIYMVRGQKVMLDFELAEIYGYSTKAFNQQVKNNIEKFDEDYRFQLTTEEHQGPPGVLPVFDNGHIYYQSIKDYYISVRRHS